MILKTYVSIQRTIGTGKRKNYYKWHRNFIFAEIYQSTSCSKKKPEKYHKSLGPS